MVFQGPFISEHQVTEDPSALPCVEQEDLENLFRRALHVVEQTGRGKNSVSVLEALTNHAKHWIHIILLFICYLTLAICCLQNHYSMCATPPPHWTFGLKMFRGKATRFFRGSMSADADETEGY